ncbi:DUF488 family protein [Capnocytophaga leadbetteri]|jgi:hypothetical protein|uniref:DUF488 domain-containing protein n=1 Tax=Capnocytophaga leadbetteri TaxID=327575 RepID=UPI0026E9607C|nr:DUF488 domain-containing protein [Capnocytophaga leadbetteri]
MIKLYTIGFTGKSAEKFFDLLKKAEVKKIIDTRINNVSQLSGFAKGTDLKFFAKEIGNISYEHDIDFAPTKDLLANYRNKKITWQEYEKEYLNLLDLRKIKSKVEIQKLHKNCLLCSEHTAEKCHRRLLAEYLQQSFNDVEIIHLVK